MALFDTQLERVARLLEDERFKVTARREIPYGVQLKVAAGEAAAVVNVFSTGKVTVQGPLADLNAQLAALLGLAAAAPRPDPPAGGPAGSRAATGSRPPGVSPELAAIAEPRIGMDESGKGDYFGPLVTAAAYVRPADEGWLKEIGVRDCKAMTDAEVLKAGDQLVKAIPCEVVVLLPPKYNVLYSKIGNLNSLLAWAHARGLESLAARVDARLAVADKFAHASVLERALQERGRGIRLVQAVRAESDPAVAAASVLARREFLRRIKALSKKCGMPLPLGASNVLGAARAYVARYGLEKLGDVAKLHFKTTGKIAE